MPIVQAPNDTRRVGGQAYVELALEGETLQELAGVGDLAPLLLRPRHARHAVAVEVMEQLPAAETGWLLSFEIKGPNNLGFAVAEPQEPAFFCCLSLFMLRMVGEWWR